MKQLNELIYRYKVALFIGILLVALIPAVACLKTGKPYLEDFFKGKFSVVGTPLLNQPVEVTFTVKPPLDVPNSTIKLWLPEGIELIEGDLEWTGDIEGGQEVQLKASVKVIETGEWCIKAHAVRGVPCGPIQNTYLIYFLTTEDSGSVSSHSTRPLRPPAKAEPLPEKLR